MTSVKSLVLHGWFAVAMLAHSARAEPMDKKAGILPIPPPYNVTPTNAVLKQEDLAGTVNMASKAAVTVSSTHTGTEGEGSPAALTDGDLKTRWSSEYSAPQSVILDFGKPVDIRAIKMHWERAAATCYGVFALMGANTWMNVHFHYRNDKDPRDRVDEFALKDVKTSKLRFDLQKNVNPDWGFSLYEIEVFCRK